MIPQAPEAVEHVVVLASDLFLEEDEEAEPVTVRDPPKRRVVPKKTTLLSGLAAVIALGVSLFVARRAGHRRSRRGRVARVGFRR